MRSKDQILLEDAYSQILEAKAFTGLTDKHFSFIRYARAGEIKLRGGLNARTAHEVSSKFWKTGRGTKDNSGVWHFEMRDYHGLHHNVTSVGFSPDKPVIAILSLNPNRGKDPNEEFEYYELDFHLKQDS